MRLRGTLRLLPLASAHPGSSDLSVASLPPSTAKRREHIHHLLQQETLDSAVLSPLVEMINSQVLSSLGEMHKSEAKTLPVLSLGENAQLCSASFP